MANDEPQQQETKPQGKQGEPQLSKHIRPKIQRKSPKSAKSAHDKNSNNNVGVTATVVEVEETRKRMESWMGLGSSSNNKNKHSNNQETAQEKKGSADEPATNCKDNVIVSDWKPKPRQRQQNQPVSILKSPKYSSTSQVVGIEASSALASSTTISVGGNVPAGAAPLKDQEHYQSKTVVVSNAKKSANSKNNKSAVICKDIVLERDPTKAATKRKVFRRTRKVNDTNDSKKQPSSIGAAHHASIEGYVPASSGIVAPTQRNPGVDKAGKEHESESSSNGKPPGSASDDEPLVFDSLEGMMRAAGETLPENPNKITSDTKMVEANISFSVMTQDQYEDKLPAMREEHEEERKRQLEVFMGKRDIFGDDDDDDDESVEGALGGDGVDNDDDDDDDAVMELLLGSDIDTDDESQSTSTARQPEVRAFTLLWDALTNWMTHETVVWVNALRDSHQTESTSVGIDDANTTSVPEKYIHSKRMDTEWSPMVDQSDIGASRCAGVLAMIRLYLGPCMEELNHPLEWRRKAEKRLNDIMRTFDYSRENPKLTAGHWKAMACILLDVVLIETREADSASIRVPPSVANMGMSKEEFEYLSRKAVLIFG
jgi:hypothetical protein